MIHLSFQHSNTVLDSNGLNLALLGCTWLYWAVVGCTGVYWAVLSCTGLCWTVLGSTSTRQYWALLCCIGQYWAVLGCTGLYWAVLDGRTSERKVENRAVFCWTRNRNIELERDGWDGSYPLSIMTIKAPAVLAHNIPLKGTFQNSDQQYLFYQNVLPLLQKLLKVPEKSRPCFTAKYIFKIFRLLKGHTNAMDSIFGASTCLKSKLSLFKSTQKKQTNSKACIFCSFLVLYLADQHLRSKEKYLH